MLYRRAAGYIFLYYFPFEHFLFEHFVYFLKGEVLSYKGSFERNAESMHHVFQNSKIIIKIIVIMIFFP